MGRRTPATVAVAVTVAHRQAVCVGGGRVYQQHEYSDHADADPYTPVAALRPGAKQSLKAVTARGAAPGMQVARPRLSRMQC